MSNELVYDAMIKHAQARGFEGAVVVNRTDLDHETLDCKVTLEEINRCTVERKDFVESYTCQEMANFQAFSPEKKCFIKETQVLMINHGSNEPHLTDYAHVENGGLDNYLSNYWSNYA